MLGLYRVEWSKLRRTLALQMVVIAPALVVLLSFVLALRANEAVNGEMDPWTRISGAGIGLWNLLMVPLFITLETALTSTSEHGNGMWKYLCATPHSRRSLFFSKVFINASLFFLAQLAFSILLLLSGYLLLLVKPGLGYSAALPLGRVFLPALVGFLTGLLILVVHTWISLRFRSIVIALGSGIGATVASMIIISSKYGAWFPWTIPGFLSMASLGMVGGLEIADPVAYTSGYLVVMVPLAALLAIAGSLEFSRGDVQ